jgi:hypothetical protein
MRKVVLVILSVLFAAACYQDGEELTFSIPETDKNPPESDYVVRVALFIDTAREDVAEVIRNAGGYSIHPGTNIKDKVTKEVPYFDYIILGGGAKMMRGGVSAKVVLGGGLKSVLETNDTLLRSLQYRGIKILLGVTGGSDGIAFGSLPQETDQKAFAKMLGNVCRYYRLDGIEFYDTDGEGSGLYPYPEIGAEFFNGEETIFIENKDFSDKYWYESAGNMANMISYLLDGFGAYSSPNGDLTADQLLINPILVREKNFGQRLTPGVPRYPFSTIMSCVGFVINDSTEEFGWEGTGKANEIMYFVDDRCYAPVIFDLSDITPEKLKEYSERLGKSAAGKTHDSGYGMVYYTNLGTSGQKERLSVTSLEIFGAEVTLLR